MVEFYFHFPVPLTCIILTNGSNCTFTYAYFTACRCAMISFVMKRNMGINLRLIPPYMHNSCDTHHYLTELMHWKHII